MNTNHWTQKRAFTIAIAVLGLVIILVVMTWNVAKYETHLASGETVLLELAPIDPRGFMQGDYMTLSYALERDILDAREQKRNLAQTNDGYVIVALDKHNVGHFVRLADRLQTDNHQPNNHQPNNHQPNNIAANEKAIHYRLRNGSVKLATNAFFFQEGHAEAFEAAKYGLFRVNDKGDPLLTNLVNETFDVIDPKDLSKVQVDNQ